MKRINTSCQVYRIYKMNSVLQFSKTIKKFPVLAQLGTSTGLTTIHYRQQALRHADGSYLVF